MIDKVKLKRDGYELDIDSRRGKENATSELYFDEDEINGMANYLEASGDYLSGHPVEESRSSRLPLTQRVRELTVPVTELKEQVVSLLKSNGCLEHDLRICRKELSEKKQAEAMHLERIDRLSRDLAELGYLKEEAEQLRKERDSLSKKIGEFGHVLVVSEQRLQETGDLLEKFRNERNEVTEEVACLNAQFSRAMKVIDELRGALSQSKDREESFESQIRKLKRELNSVNKERDTYQAELNESQNALETVRVSLMETRKEWRALRSS